MVIEKIIGNIYEYDNVSKTVDVVTVEWYEREKKRMRKTSLNGEEIGIAVDVPLNDGDIIFENEQKIIVVEFAPCELIKINVATMKEMGRLCFELGNRHRSLSISEDYVTIPFDDTDFAYLEHIGFRPQKIFGKFSDFTVCKAHGENHTHLHHHE